ncbi:MAG: DNA translocase FtsK 4TM domain-containing protein [Mogibacterium sp.]|nr:DNA translocase FtsK 4TM domain-containing protein [Mogibacterium sp.]
MAADNKNNTSKRGPGRPPGSKNKKTSGSSSGNGAKPASDPSQVKYDRIREMQEEYDRERRNLDVIWSITLAALGLFLLFTVVMNSTGTFGNTVHNICLGLFGIMAYVLPFFVIIFALLLFLRKMQHISGRTVIFSVLIFLNMCILNSYRFIDETDLRFGFLDMAEEYFKAIDGDGGGAVGMELGSILVKFFGMPGLLIIASTVLIISLFLVANTPISRFFDNMFKKHEEKRIFKELEEAETAKIKMAVASTATPGADPQTGIVEGGIQHEEKEPVFAGSARSIWKSILNGIMRTDEEPDDLPSQREQYQALRKNEQNVSAPVSSGGIVEPIAPMNPMAEEQPHTYEDDNTYTQVFGRDTFIGQIARRITGAFSPNKEVPRESREVTADDRMHYDDVDYLDFGYPGRRPKPAQDEKSETQNTEEEQPAAGKTRSLGMNWDEDDQPEPSRGGKRYGLSDDVYRPSGSYGLDGHSKPEKRSAENESLGFGGGNAAGAGIAMGVKGISGSGMDGGYEAANKRRSRIANGGSVPEKGLSEETKPAKSRSKSKGLQEDNAVSDEDAALAESFNAVAEDAAYVLPPVSLLKKPTGSRQMMSDYQLEERASLLEKTLSDFGVEAKVLTVTQGSSVTRYEVQPATGVKVASITRLADDIALNLRAKSIRIEAPIPGKAAVGIEVENDKPSPVLVRELIESEEFQSAESKIEFVVGKDISGNNVVADLKVMPHLLIAGATGSGKSVCINTIIASFLYKAKPSELKLIMIDPKVVELANYNGIPHMLTPVVTDARKASRALAIAVDEMDKRYELFAKEGVKDLDSYNELMRANHEPQRCKPQVVIIIDELADLMMASPSEVENSICRLAQKARAAGMHLIVATQRPSVDVVTGLIKANIPSRIAFSVASQIDSRTILDMAGAEKLLGRGDMLFSPVGSSKPYRVQGPYISDSEIDKVLRFVKKEGGSPVYDEEIQKAIESNERRGGAEPQDELTEDAIAFILKSGQASVSMLQRRFRIGYNRAARIIDEIEEKGIIGPSDGSRPRQVLVTEDQYFNGGMNAAQAQETIDEISPQEKAELNAKVTGKPHMNLVSNKQDEEDEVIPEPPADTSRDTAMDYFNSLPESVRKMILNSDNE